MELNAIATVAILSANDAFDWAAPTFHYPSIGLILLDCNNRKQSFFPPIKGLACLQALPSCLANCQT
jgi:hypothetical protein